MDPERKDYLHWSFQGAHILLPAIHLTSVWSFLAAALLVVGICLTERLLSFASQNRWCPTFVGQGRRRCALWRAILYWWATLLRLSYMLIAMSFHAGLILLTVTTLAFAQFIFEYQSYSTYQALAKDSYSLIEEPFLSPHEAQHCQTHATRPRSKSKPDNIFIHPNQSNIARADAAAFQLGIGANTERVQGNMYTKEVTTWETGQGAMLVSPHGMNSELN